MLFAVVKRYERNGVDFADWEYKPNAHEKIYEKIKTDMEKIIIFGYFHRDTLVIC